MNIILKPVDITEDIMKMLEEKNLIFRLSPDKHLRKAKKETTEVLEIYSSDSKYGGHKLIDVAVNNVNLKNLIYHSENEEFLIIDSEESENLVITMALIDKFELEEKIINKTLCKEDFISFICKKNNPNLSFFTMNKFIPHGETALRESLKPPGFFVTESKNIDENFINLREYSLSIKKGE